MKNITKMRKITPWAALLICLTLTFLTWLFSNKYNQEGAQQRYQYRTDQIVVAVIKRMDDYAMVLRGGAALFAASEEVTRAEWRTYVEHLSLGDAFPGIQGVGFSKVIQPLDLAGHIQQIRAEGFPQYTVRPEGERDVYTSIIFLEPFDVRNQRAFGYDMFSEPVRRAAMQQARDMDAISISGKVTLVQETEQDVQAGFLMYVPVYARGMPTNSVEERRAALQGYVYSPFRIGNLVRGIFPDPVNDIDFEVYDGDAVSPSTLMYDNNGSFSGLGEKHQSLFSSRKIINLYGHPWILVFTTLPPFESAAEQFQLWGILTAGIVISILAFLFVREQENTRERALTLAHEMTSVLCKREEELSDSEVMWRGLVNANPESVFLTDTAGIVLAANETVMQRLGKTDQETIGSNFFDLLPPTVATERKERTEQVISSGKPVRFEDLCVGRYHDNYIHPIFDRDGKLIRLAFFGLDITERKRVEEAQRKHTERATMLAEISQSLAEVIGDPQTSIALIARRVTELIGDTTIIRLVSKDGLYLDPIAVYHPDPVILAHMRELYATLRQDVNEGFAPRIFQTGQALLIPSITMEQIQATIEPRLWPILDLHSVHSLIIAPLRSQGRILGLLSVMRIQPDNPYTAEDRNFLQDLADRAALALTNTNLFSDLKAYTTRLEQSNRDLQEFAYVASHDLQEPLRKVLAFGDRLANKYGDVLDETGLDYLKRMQGASQRMQTLLNDLLSFSRVSTRAQPFTEVDLNTLAGEVLSDLENQIERSQGRVEIGELPTIEADPTQMHQLLQNLIGNALKYHKDNISPTVQVLAQIKGGECQISVKDNGIGFDIQYLDRIFKPFQRLHNREEYEGSGMGLAICRRIVERHGGKITAASTPGEGSTFIVTLPIHPSKGDNSHV